MAEGIVPGGGSTLIHIQHVLPPLLELCADDDERAGVSIVMAGIEWPIKQIAANCGVDGDIVLETVREHPQGFGYGYNAKEDRYEDLLAANIVDPARVACQSLMNAASVAAMVLTTDCIVLEPQADGPMMGDGMGGLEGEQYM